MLLSAALASFTDTVAVHNSRPGAVNTFDGVPRNIPKRKAQCTQVPKVEYMQHTAP